MLRDVSARNMSLQFEDTHCLLKKHKRKRCLHFLAPSNRDRKQQWESSTNSTTFDKQHTNFCRQIVQKRDVLVSLDSWDSWGSCLPWEPLLPMTLHLHRFPSRHLHVEFQMTPRHHQLEPDPCPEFSVGLTSALLCPTRYSAAENCSRYRFLLKLKMLSSM